MSRPAKAEYYPANPEKYIGTYPIVYRSSWEHSVMRVFDAHPYVLAWASESVSIPYINPLTGKWAMYVPDFLVVYADKNGQKHAEIIEVKPMKERPDYVRKAGERLSKRTQLTQIINAAKFMAAATYCKKNKMRFRVASENELFAWSKK